MAKLDTSRKAWQRRLDRFSSEKKQIEQSGLSKEDQNLAINNLLESSFSGTEKVRAKAINQLL